MTGQRHVSNVRRAVELGQSHLSLVPLLLPHTAAAAAADDPDPVHRRRPTNGGTAPLPRRRACLLRVACSYVRQQQIPASPGQHPLWLVQRRHHLMRSPAPADGCRSPAPLPCSASCSKGRKQQAVAALLHIEAMRSSNPATMRLRRVLLQQARRGGEEGPGGCGWTAARPIDRELHHRC